MNATEPSCTLPCVTGTPADRVAARVPPVLWLLMLCVTTVYFVSYFQRVAIPGTIFNHLQTDFQASAGDITRLASIFLYIYAGMQLLAGMLNDRFGAFRVLRIGGGLLVLGSFLFPLAFTLPALYAARALVGLGASLVYLSMVKTLVTYFTARHFAILLGISLAVGYSGGLAGTLPFDLAVRAWGWRATLLGVALLGTLGLLGAAWFQSRIPGGMPAVSRGARSRLLLPMLRNRRTLALLMVHSTNFSVYFLFQSVIGKKLLMDHFAIAETEAAAFTFGMMFTTIACLLSSGFLSRAIGNRRTPLLKLATALMLAGTLILMVCLWRGGARGWILAGYGLLAMTSLASPMGNTLMKEYHPPESVGTAVGLINGSAYLSVALYTSLAGWILNQYQGQVRLTDAARVYPRQAYLAILGFCAILLVGSLVFSFRVRETRGHPLEAETT